MVVADGVAELGGDAWGRNGGGGGEWLFDWPCVVDDDRLDQTGFGQGPYANTDATDWGVNLDASGALTGYAWSSQTGWIIFNPTHGQVTIDTTTGRFDGHAWSPTIGWIGFQNAAPAYSVRTTAYGSPPAQSGSLFRFR